MKKIIEYKHGTRSYAIGDVVFLYFNHKKMKPTCMAEAVKNDNGSWTFRLIGKNTHYLTIGRTIPFSGKPFIFAKEVEIKEEQL